jgi:hypothetical protein
MNPHLKFAEHIRARALTDIPHLSALRCVLKSADMERTQSFDQNQAQIGSDGASPVNSGAPFSVSNQSRAVLQYVKCKSAPSI